MSITDHSLGRFERVDAFWVESTPDEADQAIEPRMNEFDRESIELMRRGYGWPHKGECCFLIARDLRFIRAFWNHYPYHQLWNGRSPFREIIPEITIDGLGELAALRTPGASAI